MNVMQRAAEGVKAFTMRFAGRVSSMASAMWLPQREREYARSVGDGSGSAIVMACVMWGARTFPEAPVRVSTREADGTLKPDLEHPMTALLERPNEFYSGVVLSMATWADFTISGNAYWIKVRSAGQRVVELWYVPSTMIEPKWDDAGTTFITHYEYTLGSQDKPIRLEPTEIVHFRNMIDPKNPRKGLSPLATVIREIFTDHEGADYTAALLKNMGIPGIIVSPDGDMTISEDEGEIVKDKFDRRFGGDKRGSTMVMLGKTKVDVLSFNPQQMDLKALRRIPEERVSAVLGIPAIVAGLGAGLDRSTFANMSEAREMAYESNIIPTQRMMAADLKTQLLDDFVDDVSKYVVDFDLSNVRVLQEDETAKTERMNKRLDSGAITVAEYRSGLGYPTDASHDVYLRWVAKIEVPVGTEGQTIDVVDGSGGAGPGSAGPSKGLPPPRQINALEDAEMKASRRQLQHIRRLEREAHAISKTFSADLTRGFRRLGADVAGKVASRKSLVMANGFKDNEAQPAYPIGPDDVDEVVPTNITQYIQPAFESMAQLVGEAAYGAASDALGVGIDWNLSNADAIALIQEAGAQAGLIDLTQQTKDAILKALADGAANGDSVAALVDRIEAYVSGSAMYPGIAAAQGDAAAAAYRAETIARTEVGTAMNNASIDAYKASGVVQDVTCYDGDGCGFTDHDDPDLANGSVRSFDDARAYPLAHPRCVRAYAPNVIGV